MHRYEDSKYIKQIRLTEEDLDWIKKNKGKKSAAGFLEQIIKQAKDNGQIISSRKSSKTSTGSQTNL